MTDYNPPLKDMLFNIHELSGLKRVLQLERFADFDTDIVDQVVEEASKFAAEGQRCRRRAGIRGCVWAIC